MNEQPTCSFTEVKATCCVCGESKPIPGCFPLADGWLCAVCDLAGRVWAARMARNPEKVFDVPISAIHSMYGVTIASISGISPLPFDTDKPFTVEADRG